MIELYTAPTGNGFRAAIAVAEAGLPFVARTVDLAASEQRAPWFLELNPLGQIPVLVDRPDRGGEPLIVRQSAAIMLYLAEKTGRFLPAQGAARARVLELFMEVCVDVAGINATLTLGSNEIAEPDKPTLAYFEQLLRRHFTMVDGVLADQEWLAGTVSIADLALYPHAVRRAELIDQWELRHLLAWSDRMARRPGVQLGMSIPVRPQDRGLQ